MDNLNYASEIQADIRVWYGSMSSAEISESFGLPVYTGHNVGDERKAKSRTRYKESYCSMTLIEKASCDMEVVINKCVQFLESNACFRKKIISEGGRIWIVIKIYDTKYLSITFDRQTISKLSDLLVGINFENHIPE